MIGQHAELSVTVAGRRGAQGDESNDRRERIASCGSALLLAAIPFADSRAHALTPRTAVICCNSPSQSDYKVNLWLSGNVELSRALCYSPQADLLSLLLAVLVDILLSALEDDLTSLLVGDLVKRRKRTRPESAFTLLLVLLRCSFSPGSWTTSGKKMIKICSDLKDGDRVFIDSMRLYPLRIGSHAEI